MTVPVFEEYEPAADCDCAGCVQQRRFLAAGGHPAGRGCRRALVVFTAAGMALSSAGAGSAGAVGHPDKVARSDGVARSDVAARVVAGGAVIEGVAGGGAVVGPGKAFEPEPITEQGDPGPLYGPPLGGTPGNPGPLPTAPLRKMTRAEIINRAKTWVKAAVPYNMDRYWSDGYRQDCSGYVSMAWNLAGNEWTGSLAGFGTRILREDLQPGDILLFHNLSNPSKGSHVTIFGGWVDYTHTYYNAYEQTPPNARKQATPMAYWNNSAGYVAYRYKGLTASSSAGVTGTTVPDDPAGTTVPDDPAGTTVPAGPTGAVTSFPGPRSFGPGAENPYVTQLGEMLVARGGTRFYPDGPGSRWSEADRLATRAFQLAQGWQGTDADGMPGPKTWRLLATGQGENIPAAGAGGPAGTSAGTGAGTGAAAPRYPGGGYFRPGRSSTYVTQLGRQLVQRGYGRHYAIGPGPQWSEADRRNVEAFQRAQGWRGASADGFPGPETWRRLFLA
ncbi:peptidoglycan-binding protein [Streptomyces sp. NBC_01142]|uniref:peptidoglycan-binding protein n=1 Tax=Streptomyces sp. NBC_01142 TaxID=2975865 RepID=UPI002258E9AE|nr:peptidoglycan-binding protein [Streptomyces sp. NBC_01142]MCX4823328.1 peptidoglycan-binding protein [Streptomyces sp. NBC_01142]